MAKIKAGILSKVSGKVAGVVGGTWKGQNYLRELVKPSNPNTPLQQAQRGKMAFTVRTARQLVGDVLNPYLNKFCKTMSGYNWFCRENIKKVGGDPLKFTSVPVIAFGTLGTGNLSTDDLTANYTVNFATVPSVPAGHSLKAITVAIDESGNVMGSYEVSSPAEDAVAIELDDTIKQADGKFAAIVFFADYDANGVLQAISASTSTDFLNDPRD